MDHYSSKDHAAAATTGLREFKRQPQKTIGYLQHMSYLHVLQEECTHQNYIKG